MKIENRPITPEEKQNVSDGFDRHCLAKDAPPHCPEDFCFVATDDEGVIKGTIYGHMVWDWMYIDVLYAEDTCRNKGLGTSLMQKAETLATERGLCGIYLTTQNWQAPGFYEKMGYTPYYDLPDFPRGHSRIGFRKYL